MNKKDIASISREIEKLVIDYFNEKTDLDWGEELLAAGYTSYCVTRSILLTIAKNYPDQKSLVGKVPFTKMMHLIYKDMIGAECEFLWENNDLDGFLAKSELKGSATFKSRL